MTQIKNLQSGDQFAGHEVISNETNQYGRHELVLQGALDTLTKTDFADDEECVDITLPNSMQTIGDNVFENCKQLQNIDMTNMSNAVVENINISKLGLNSNTTITFPNGIVEKLHHYSPVIADDEQMEKLLDGDVQDECPIQLNSNELYYTTTDGNPLTINESLVASHANNKIVLKSTTVPASLFVDQTNLLHVYFANNITAIGDSAFKECGNLNYVVLPNSVTTLGDHSFYGCDRMVMIKLSNAITEIPSYCFGACANLLMCNMPSNLQRIGEYAFYACLNVGMTWVSHKYVTGSSENEEIFRLKRLSLVMPDSLIEIGDYAFSKACVESIDFGNTRTTMPSFGEHWDSYYKDEKYGWVRYRRYPLVITHVVGEKGTSVEDDKNYAFCMAVPDALYDLWKQLSNLNMWLDNVVYYAQDSDGYATSVTANGNGTYSGTSVMTKVPFTVNVSDVWHVATKNIRRWSDRLNEFGLFVNAYADVYENGDAAE